MNKLWSYILKISCFLLVLFILGYFVYTFSVVEV